MFPSGTSITTNQAKHHARRHRRDDRGPQRPDVEQRQLSASPTAPAFTTAGDFSNTGSLTIGAGSTLTVNGNYTQGSSASLDGRHRRQPRRATSTASSPSPAAPRWPAPSTPRSPAASRPAAGDSFPIVTYASETGGNSLTFTGLNSGALSIFQPVVGPTSIDLNAVTSPANLVVQPFSVAANAVVGQNLTVTYQVDNESSNAATGTWTDSVYLSTQPTLNSSSVLLGRVQQTRRRGQRAVLRRRSPRRCRASRPTITT